MTISLIVEDGSGLSNANCYVGVDDARDYATNRGVTLSGTDDAVAVQILLATDYLESFRDRYKGARVSITQALSWPRVGADLYDDVAYKNLVWFPSDAIPKELIAAQCQAVVEQANGIVLMPTTSGQFVTQETVGPLTTKYSEVLGTSQQPFMPAVKALLRNLIIFTGLLRNMRG